MTSFAHLKTVCMFAFFPGRDLKAFKYAHRKIKPFSKSFTRETQQNFQNIVLCGIYFYCLNGQSGVRFFQSSNRQHSFSYEILDAFSQIYHFSRNASFFGGVNRKRVGQDGTHISTQQIHHCFLVSPGRFSNFQRNTTFTTLSVRCGT